MKSPACEKIGAKKVIRVIDRDTAAEFIADFLLDPTIKLRPDQYQVISVQGTSAQVKKEISYEICQKKFPEKKTDVAKGELHFRLRQQEAR